MRRHSTSTTARDCDPAIRRTRSLLGYGVLAGPFYVALGLAQALTRDGFDLTRHDLSLLANGRLGWIQIANLVLTGMMTIAASAGISRALRSGRGSTWGPRLLACYGAGLIGAGAFAADPAAGFPPGTPEGPGAVSWHGMLHFIMGGLGFLALIAACFVIARRFVADARPGWALWSRLTGVVFLVGFAAIASGSGNPATVLGFWGAVLVAWAWLSTLSLHLYRHADHVPLGVRGSREIDVRGV
jgi:hypothetical protein